mmetsp:Transcript_19861/g.48604  ORF Transcript_19861/g.48604 Transcript_19861/m.48604 type:complete len:101 (-) Transcript_19861:180-482(-)
MERVMTLLAFPNPSNTTVRHLLSSERMEKVVNALNTAILTLQCQSRDPKLLSLLQHLVYTQKALKEDRGHPFPTIRNFETAQFELEEKKTSRSSRSESKA